MANTMPSVTQPSELAKWIAIAVRDADELEAAVGIVAEHIAMLERDAERYRLLRKRAWIDDYGYFVAGLRVPFYRGGIETPEQMDAGVDEALARVKSQDETSVP